MKKAITGTEKNTSRQSLLERLTDQFRVLQKRNRFVAGAHDTGLDLMESHALVELSANSNLSAADMQRLLSISKSANFRLFRRLKQEGFLAAKSQKNKVRQPSFQITTRGRKVLQAFDSAANANLERFCEGLSREECLKLLKYFEVVADWYGVLPSPKRAAEHILRPAMRRVTRAFGLLGDSVLGSGLNSVKWHCMHEIASNPVVGFGGDLSRILGISPTTVSYTVRWLEKSKLVKREKSERDGRHQLIKVTKRGQELLTKLQRHFVDELSSALENLELEELKEFVSIMAGLTSDAKTSGLTGSLERAETSTVRAELRRFFVGRLIQDKGPLDLPAVLFGSDSVCYGLRVGAEILACLEIRLGEGNPVLLNVAWDRAQINSASIKEFILGCLGEVFPSMKDLKIETFVSAETDQLLKELSQALPNGGPFQNGSNRMASQ